MKLFSKTTLVILIISFFACFNKISSMKFIWDVQAKEAKCIGEYLIENTLALFSVTSDTTKKDVKLIDPNGVNLYNKKDEETIKIAYTAKESGNYQLCFTNTDRTHTRITFEILTGVAAQDYSSIAKQSNIKPMELNVR
jgi:hypothetical protein